jgi:hypothetical protein
MFAFVRARLPPIARSAVFAGGVVYACTIPACHSERIQRAPNPHVSQQERCEAGGGTITCIKGEHPRTLYELHSSQQLACGTETIEPNSEVR